jgi:hypothetical protein
MRRSRLAQLILFILLAALAALLMPASMLAQISGTVAVSGHFGDAGGAPTSGSYVHLQLTNCSNNIPRVVGSGTIVKQTKDFTPDSNGLISGQIIPNDLINCGGVADTTRYLVTNMVNNVPQGPQQCFHIVSNENPFNFDSQTPCSMVTPPPPPPGPNDGVFHNLNVTGFLSGTDASFSGTLTAGIIHTSHLFADLITLPSGQDCDSGQFMTGYGANLEKHCGSAAAIPVTSVFGRAGAVGAQAGDYNCGMITGAVCSLQTLRYQTVISNGTTYAQRSKLVLNNGTNASVACADNSGNDSTDCTVSASGSGTGLQCPTTNQCYRIDASGLIEQWATGTASFTGRGQTSITWPISFPNSCINVQATVQFNSHLSSGNWQGAAAYVQPDNCQTAVQLYIDIRGDGSVDGPFHVLVYGMGR